MLPAFWKETQNQLFNPGVHEQYLIVEFLFIKGKALQMSLREQLALWTKIVKFVTLLRLHVAANDTE